MNGWTTLHKAAYYGDHDGIEALLEYGADRTLGRLALNALGQRKWRVN